MLPYAAVWPTLRERMIVAIDQGTSGTTAIVVNAEAEIVARGYAPLAERFPRPGWVEQDAGEIWSSVETAVRAALAAAGEPAIAAVGITNQRETIVAWDAATGRPLAPAIGWQCRRTARACDRLRESGAEPDLRRRTGLLLDPYFSATKMAWLLQDSADVADARNRGTLRLGTVDSWLIWNLAGGAHITDASNASRTLLLDINNGSWSDELVGIFGVPRAALADVVPSSGTVATTGPDAPTGAGLPIAGVAGDQHAALFGHLATETGDTKVTYGTGCFLLQQAGSRRPIDVDGLLTTIAWRIDDRLAYALEGSVFVGGALVQWLRDGLRLIASADETERLGRTVPDTRGAVIVPAFVGLGAPHWDPRARGTILGLTHGVGRAHLCRAALEAIAHQVADVVEIMPASDRPLLVDGGAAANRLLLELQASILGCAIHRPAQLETTALGAAYLAGLGVGEWSSPEQLRAIRPAGAAIEPPADVSVTSRGVWREAVRRASDWAGPEG